METNTRNATLADLATMLQEQNARKVDVVAPATSITSKDGALRIEVAEPVLSEDGVTLVNGLYVPTSVCDEGIAEKLGIPVQYLRRLREQRPDLYDANVNGWLHGQTRPGWDDERQKPIYVTLHEGDTRKFLVRCFSSGSGDGKGIARAFLSDRYRMVDNLDVLMSVLEGIEDAGVEVKIDTCDLSDRRMYVKVVAPQVTAMAHTLLKDYRNPFGEDFERWRSVADREGLGYGDGSEPVVWAGLVFSNSEVGGGAFSITPRAVVRVCKNGLTITKDMVREVHLGGRLEEGVIDWSADTQQKAVELVRAKTRDAVATFLDPAYLQRAVDKLEKRAGEPVHTVDEVKVLTKPMRFSDAQVAGILNRFVQGGQMSRGGVVNAITAHAQEVGDADAAADMEVKAAGLLV